MSVEALRQQKMYDEGLRQFMLNMYNHTAAGLAVSGITAWIVYATGLVFALGPMLWIFMFAPLAMIFYYSFANHNWSLEKLTKFYYLFTIVMGISLSTIFVAYTALSIIQVFFITSATFASASLYGYTTKKDLTTLGSFLIVGLIGIVIASIVNLFIGSDSVQFAISILGVLIFTGLTAWDTQNAKNIFLSHNGDAKFGIHFAMSLYLNFINLFQMLLNLLAEEK